MARGWVGGAFGAAELGAEGAGWSCVGARSGSGAVETALVSGGGGGEAETGILRGVWAGVTVVGRCGGRVVIFVAAWRKGEHA